MECFFHNASAAVVVAAVPLCLQPCSAGSLEAGHRRFLQNSGYLLFREEGKRAERDNGGILRGDISQVFSLIMGNVRFLLNKTEGETGWCLEAGLWLLHEHDALKLVVRSQHGRTRMTFI